MVSVIIVNWNGKEYISKCLESLKKQTFREFSVILVDNCSNDGSLGIVRKNFSDTKIIRLAQNFGFAKACNIGIKEVKTPYTVLLNNDAIAHQLWLEELVNAMNENRDIGFAASKMIFYYNPDSIDRAGDAYTRAGAGLLRGRGEPIDNFNEKELIFGACGAAAIYRTSMLKKIGLFDENFFLLYEDVDLSFRAQLQGYRCLYVPKAVVYHMSTQSIGYDSDVSVYYGHRNLEWVYTQNMPSKLLLRTLLPHILYDFAALLYFLYIGRGKIFLKAKKDAIKYLPRALKKRKIILKKQTVTDVYIFNLMEREFLFPRYTRRMEKGKERKKLW